MGGSACGCVRKRVGGCASVWVCVCKRGGGCARVWAGAQACGRVRDCVHKRVCMRTCMREGGKEGECAHRFVWLA